MIESLLTGIAAIILFYGIFYISGLVDKRNERIEKQEEFQKEFKAFLEEEEKRKRKKKLKKQERKRKELPPLEELERLQEERKKKYLKNIKKRTRKED